MSGHFEKRLARELSRRSEVAFRKGLGGGAANCPVLFGLAPRKNDAGGHPFNIPLPRATDGFIEVVQIKNQFSVRRSERSEVLYMCISAELRMKARVRQTRQVGSHDRYRATKEGERRTRHSE